MQSALSYISTLPALWQGGGEVIARFFAVCDANQNYVNDFRGVACNDDLYVVVCVERGQRGEIYLRVLRVPHPPTATATAPRHGRASFT
jgi:hypothetical protein